MSEPVLPHNDDAPARDAAWMSRIAQGDRNALGELMRAHQARVFQTACRFAGSADVAEDIVQEAFLRVFRSAAGYRPQAAFTTWLYRLVVNLCWDHRRRAARERRRRSAFPTELMAAAPVDHERSERAEQVRAAILALPDRQRLVVILHRFDGLSHGEIREITGWSMGAIESCLVRAYAALRARLEGLNA